MGLNWLNFMKLLGSKKQRVKIDSKNPLFLCEKTELCSQDHEKEEQLMPSWSKMQGTARDVA